jgi:hypothetical protein
MQPENTSYVGIVTAQTEKEQKEKPPETATIVNRYADAVPLTLVELAKAMRRSRWTIYRWKIEGYRFEFGRLTTLGHLKNWLRQQALKKSGTEKEAERQNAVLARLK